MRIKMSWSFSKIYLLEQCWLICKETYKSIIVWTKTHYTNLIYRRKMYRSNGERFPDDQSEIEPETLPEDILFRP